MTTKKEFARNCMCASCMTTRRENLDRVIQEYIDSRTYFIRLLQKFIYSIDQPYMDIILEKVRDLGIDEGDV